MPRKPRLDPPDSWHHVVNRGIAKRPLFEHRDDARYFLSRLAHQVRCGRVEVHAYSLLQTHFHLLLRSPGGSLSEAMRRVQNFYVRRFNRQRRRDGSLARGRFFSRLVDSDEYLHALVRYIDHNAVRAGLANTPGDYEHCSARHYLRGTGPPWLNRAWVEDQACVLTGAARFSGKAYRAAYGVTDPRQMAALEEVVEARVATSDFDGDADADRLFAAALGGARAWMRWKARLADGVRLGQPVCGVAALHRAIDADAARDGPWYVTDRGQIRQAAEIARIGLLHALCCRSDRRLAEVEGGSAERVRRLRSLHRRLLQIDPQYARRAMEIGRAAVIAAWPAESRNRVRHPRHTVQHHGA